MLSEKRVNLPRGFLLHVREHMRVGVERNADGRVPKALAHDFWMDVCAEQQRRMRVTKRVERAVPDASLLDEPRERARKLSRIGRSGGRRPSKRVRLKYR